MMVQILAAFKLSNGAQPLGRFIIETSVGVRISQSIWKLKRPKSRAPSRDDFAAFFQKHFLLAAFVGEGVFLGGLDDAQQVGGLQ